MYGSKTSKTLGDVFLLLHFQQSGIMTWMDCSHVPCLIGVLLLVYDLIFALTISLITEETCSPTDNGGK